ncbi:hypothetical protein BLS_008053 [Venturia inaequalis]|uniref:Yeast cell wall synthesis Kre9/Knh1-like N-terminal domain-containing protein n=1 Tax=Venturia inaequalis TaxID=5025 RepID=A0A8H3Z8I2_VENIN|nr:hypothetical protein BLS_008053 [Venturia inaequalis]KAE9981719.1 hypothetical protein EG327_006120 [Venturia inaequalis]KAE9983366.1 hypothetical protein EG328_010003 [Venturia inaequalis]RDI83274.1 putative Xaa-Pro aminopeptidase [Venturia inaequalis]
MLFVQILALAAGAAALSVTAPVAGASISQSDELSISWDAVSSDTATFDIHLALSTDSGNSQTIKTGVSPSDKSYKTSASPFSPGTYTINLVGTSKDNTGVLAQSKPFTIVKASGSSTSSNSSSTATGSSTVSGTASASASKAGNATAAASSHAASAAASSSSSATVTSVSIVGLSIAVFAAFMI